MPSLNLIDVPIELFQRVQRLAAAHQRTPESEALAILEDQLAIASIGKSQAELLAALNAADLSHRQGRRIASNSCVRTASDDRRACGP